MFNQTLTSLFAPWFGEILYEVETKLEKGRGPLSPETEISIGIKLQSLFGRSQTVRSRQKQDSAFIRKRLLLKMEEKGNISKL